MRAVFLYIVVASLGALTAFEPVEWKVGLFAAAAIFAAGRSAAALAHWRRLAVAVGASILFSVLLFPWMYSSVRVYTQASVGPSVIITAIFYLLNNGKLAIFLYGCGFLPHRQRSFPLYAAGLLLFIDLVYPSVIPWFWGNFILPWDWLRPGVYYAGTPLWGLLWLVVAYYAGAGSLWLGRRLVGAHGGANKVKVGQLGPRLMELWRDWLDEVKTQLPSYSRRHPLKALAVLGSLGAVLAGLWAGALFSLNMPVKGESPAGPYLRVGILQTNTGRGAEGLGANSQAGSLDYTAHFQRALQTFYEMGRRVNEATRNTLDLLVYPESAVPFKGIQPPSANELGDVYSTQWHQAIRNLAHYSHQTVVVNALYRPTRRWAHQLGIAAPTKAQGAKKKSADPHSQGLSQSYFNSLYFMAPNRSMMRYDKRRLVPFGEYLPGESLWPGLRQFFPETARYIAAGDEDPFTKIEANHKAKKTRRPILVPYYGGHKPATLLPSQWPEFSETLADDLDKLGVSQPTAKEPSPTNKAQPLGQVLVTPLICYEDLFPAAARPLLFAAESSEGQAAKPPGQGHILLNSTNNSWFGAQAANQHSSLARFRAMEQRAYFIRATLSGTSSVIAPDGAYLTGPMPAGKAQVALARIPISGRKKPVVWQLTALYMPWLAVAVWTLCLFPGAMGVLKRR